MDSGWRDVWARAVAQIAHQSVVANILLVLGAAFLLAMALEGIRTSFFPRRAAPDTRTATTFDTEPMDEPPSLQAMPARQPGTHAFARRSAPRNPRILGAQKPSRTNFS